MHMNESLLIYPIHKYKNMKLFFKERINGYIFFLKRKIT